ncbi:hypothetical protein AC579_1231 [Pseudocercospora musae]|uniref:Fumarylacetoacetase-like C-terminal domain-containing protein n=1 Tax=Pseudocercospora musae TaxID=113226 RepID=A0A139I5H8_9PEZI|nr:hypothetical protein AC579_1231 [Pseudocercospora musae]
MASLRGQPLPRATARFTNALRPWVQRRWATESNEIDGMLKKKTKWEAFPDSIRKLAVFAEHARSHNYQIPLLSKAQSGAGEFDQTKAYHIAAAIRQLREMNGEVVAGRKIGFTNTNIWHEYGIGESNWSYMYQNTIIDLPSCEEITQGKTMLADLRSLNAMEPRIEPEITLGLKSVPRPDMNDLDILSCIEWIAHGFEIVASVFPHWKFTAADTTAAFALHGLLLVGPRKMLRGNADATFLQSLQDFEVRLYRDGKELDSGHGHNVLGSPIKALRHLTELLAKDEYNKPLEAGEVVTTGTLTRAFPIRNGEHWSTKLKGLDLPGLNLRFRTE